MIPFVFHVSHAIFFKINDMQNDDLVKPLSEGKSILMHLTIFLIQ